MVEIIWEFVVREDSQGLFELAYGPGGAWSNLFKCCAGFRGITLLRDSRNPRRYLSIELWDSGAKREQALSDHKEEYAELDSAFDEWTESKSQVGIFNVRGQATVRPQARSKRR
jgi:heme-degrading monooxygenase HmoA